MSVEKFSIGSAEYESVSGGGGCFIHHITVCVCVCVCLTEDLMFEGNL
jgi:hypothetical protein